MTLEGSEKLREELHQLKVLRPQIIDAIARAREHGDLRENAEYHAAREQQSLVEGKIRDIENKLSNAHIVDVKAIEPNAHAGKVIFGATVTLFNLDNEQTISYQIVGEDEADLKLGKISVTSPVARALIGKEVGDTIEVQVPGGKASYEIEAVEYR